MGNYLLSFRVPPPAPEDDERNHPLYYDWSIPKFSLFREPAESAHRSSATVHDNESSEVNKPELNKATKIPTPISKSSKTTSVKEVSGRTTTIKDALTRKDSTPIDKRPSLTTQKSLIAKSLSAHKAQNNHRSNATESSRPHKLDPVKNDGVESQTATVRAATKVHTAARGSSRAE